MFGHEFAPSLPLQSTCRATTTPSQPQLRHPFPLHTDTCGVNSSIDYGTLVYSVFEILCLLLYFCPLPELLELALCVVTHRDSVAPASAVVEMLCF